MQKFGTLHSFKGQKVTHQNYDTYEYQSMCVKWGYFFVINISNFYTDGRKGLQWDVDFTKKQIQINKDLDIIR